MPVRMTGMISNMDTESLIKGMMDAQRLKNKKVTDKQTLLTWKQDKWKELNAKLYKLYTEDLSKMRLQGNYATKKAVSSDDSIATITANSTSATGSHTLKVTNLASSQYVTSGILDKSVTTSTKLKDVLGMTSTDGKDTVIKIVNGDKEKNLIVTSTTTLGDFISSCQSVGLNANYDTTQRRLFISSKSSGADNKFSITTGEISSAATSALADINSLVNFAGIDSTKRSKVTEALKLVEGMAEGKSESEIEAELDTLYQSAVDGTKGADTVQQKIIDALADLRNYVIDKVKTDVRAAAKEETTNEIKTAIYSKYSDPDATTLSTLEAEIQSEIDAGTLPATTDVTQAAIERYKQNQAVLDDLKSKVHAKLESGELTVPEGKTEEEFINETAQSDYETTIQSDRTKMFQTIVSAELATTEKQDRIEEIYTANLTAATNAALTGTDGLVAQLKIYVTNAKVDDNSSFNNLERIGLGEIDGSAVTTSDKTKMTVIAAEDASIVLDGAELTSASNSFTAAGITFNLLNKTDADKSITLSVSNDTQATYDMVKKFISSYNEILKEMNTLYNAPSSRGYDPLSDDEKEAMTESQIEKWETKIKDSILRRDSTLGSVIDAMRNALTTSVEVNGKRYSLSSYGIQTSNDYSEKGLLHIAGNKDDSVFSSLEDKLMKALESDPDTVITVLSGISKKLYDTMTEKMSSIPNVRSAYTFYNDKTMATQQTEYKKKIAVLEDKLTEMENKYYKQFAAMETAMAKLQSQTNALASMMGRN